MEKKLIYCKLQEKCFRPDCPFLHKKPSKPILEKVDSFRPEFEIKVVPKKIKNLCLFKEKCTNKNCPFRHPERELGYP